MTTRPEIPLEVLREYFTRVVLDRTGECWLWPERKTAPTGYGTLVISRAKYGGQRAFLAHRVSYMLNKGPIPDGLIVRHTCDQHYAFKDITYRRCVNPEHLLSGTHQDNSNDMIDQGRSACGERHVHAVLTEEKVRDILRGKRTRSAISLAIEHDVTEQTVYAIWAGRTWRYLSGCRTGGTITRGKLTHQQAQAILNALREGVNARKLAARYGVHLQTVYAIKYRKIWKALR